MQTIDILTLIPQRPPMVMVDALVHFDPVASERIDPESGEGATEYNEEEFSDEQFKCECPRCGFRFNP